MPFTTHLLPPPAPNSKGTPKFTLPTRTTPDPPTNPRLLTDALTIRQTVFIDEQHCSAEEEIDADDGRSWHWVVYHTPEPTASTPAGAHPPNQQPPQADATERSDRTPVATIRLVPPPNIHEHHNHNRNGTGNGDGAEQEQEQEQEQEPYIKLTRVAVLREYRGYGLGRAVVETALAWAREHAREIDAASAAYASVEGKEKDGAGVVVARPLWNGLVLVHAQTQVEKMYERCGFVTDEGMGRWDENEIEHLGMWRRLVLE
ncbi:hypothetical protein ASPACDRAFT_1851575 [Aspergillus aculeatus ATCC 16872]|uniref:Glucosamine 6-phosphate N-acetyltransferase n=1 Tax=Aspergillus aculeatus (strain ATCC 16872 / CBS 172.66 / WB 5094) TaxID=690307 RepID=A0A1L9X824_ASPA1|nr:uncharacterized protein ASPACDRAFT_1851575 [Aspergillus aculeatus ATCC 16872]OJK04595.1 hypothetical protein ASPACDRAFT_1851575 [Aspergillus aculeatus ATCC 16872]